MTNPFEQISNEINGLHLVLAAIRAKIEGMGSYDPLEVITGEELKNRLDISETTLKRYRDAGKIPYVQVGGQFRYNYPEVIKALSKGGKYGRR